MSFVTGMIRLRPVTYPDPPCVCVCRLQRCLQPLEQLQRETAAELAAVRRQLAQLQRAQQDSSSAPRPLSPWLVLLLALLAQLLTGWWLRRG